MYPTLKAPTIAQLFSIKKVLVVENLLGSSGVLLAYIRRSSDGFE